MPKNSPKPKRGRPNEGRVPVKCYIKPHVRTHILGLVDKMDISINTTGKVIEEKFGYSSVN